jgi:hypothetical protein
VLEATAGNPALVGRTASQKAKPSEFCAAEGGQRQKSAKSVADFENFLPRKCDRSAVSDAPGSISHDQKRGSMIAQVGADVKGKSNRGMKIKIGCAVNKIIHHECSLSASQWKNYYTAEQYKLVVDPGQQIFDMNRCNKLIFQSCCRNRHPQEVADG